MTEKDLLCDDRLLYCPTCGSLKFQKKSDRFCLRKLYFVAGTNCAGRNVDFNEKMRQQRLKENEMRSGCLAFKLVMRIVVIKQKN